MGNLPSTPVPPTIDEKNIRDQSGKNVDKTLKVFVITGATSGIGYELAKILYSANATVWIVARSEVKANKSMDEFRRMFSGSTGTLKYLQVDFNDLRTIKPAVDEFLRRESRIDVLWNNAGIMIPPKGSTTEQGYEAQLGVNAIAPFLFTKLLTDTLIKSVVPLGKSTRVVWVSSSAAANFAPPGGVDMTKLSNNGSRDYSQWQNYGISKAANILLSLEFARRYDSTGIVSVAIDPGNLETNLYQNMPRWQFFLAKRTALKPAIYGAYTELFAGLSEDVSNGTWIIPWGSISSPRKDIADAGKSTAEGGTAAKFWEWCETEVASYIS